MGADFDRAMRLLRENDVEQDVQTGVGVRCCRGALRMWCVDVHGCNGLYFHSRDSEPTEYVCMDRITLSLCRPSSSLPHS